MPLSRETIDRIIYRLERVDDSIDEAQDAIAGEDEAAALGYIAEAAERKHRVIALFPRSFREVYDIFYFLDLAADTATSYPNGAIGEDVDVDDLIENLEQSLDDLEHLDDEYDFPDGMERMIQDLIHWFRGMIEYYKKHKKADPNLDGSLPRDRKYGYFAELDPTQELSGAFHCLDFMDRNLFLARRRLEKDPPDYSGAAKFLRFAEQEKHSLIDELRGRASTGGDEPPEPGAEDLPKHPYHA